MFISASPFTHHTASRAAVPPPRRTFAGCSIMIDQAELVLVVLTLPFERISFDDGLKSVLVSTARPRRGLRAHGHSTQDRAPVLGEQLTLAI